MIQYEKLQEIAGAEHVHRDEPMSSHTTFRIGGPADYYVETGDEQTLAGLVCACRRTDTPFFILGNGSNGILKPESNQYQPHTASNSNYSHKKSFFIAH